MRAISRYLNSRASTLLSSRFAPRKFDFYRAERLVCRGRKWGQISSTAFSSFSTTSDIFDYKLIDDAENISGYTQGGYHPIQIADVIHNRYTVVDKLGYGGWSTVWLAHDHRGKEYVALKVGVADALPQEVKVLRALATSVAGPGSEAIPRILDDFRIEGPNGSHPCYTTSPAVCNLRESSFNRLIPIDVARAMAYKLTLAVAYVHSRGYVHGDIHLRNVLVRGRLDLNHLSIAQFRDEYGEPYTHPVERVDGHSPPPWVPSTVTEPIGNMGKRAYEYTIHDAHVLLGDFGESYAPAEEQRRGKDCHTPLDFRPPETYFEPCAPLTFSADIWSLATAIWDILGMQALFSSAFCTDQEVLCQLVDTLGPLPIDWLKRWDDGMQFFDEKGEPKTGRYISPKIDEAFEECVQHYRRKDGVDVFCPDESAAIIEMMRQMLRYQPGERPTIDQVLRLEWMEKWAYPDYMRAQRMV
ncbi:protein kinase domain-containing protein [Moelleriella libera RCEF 2490]|uniref:non-specific serine/threonine protein kinase n=1 Tax=Moelleriella libera RCEF 2490 TaxID=1081109 RepID=A0A167ZP36_9HYPO|nr:protein kinase domain-containing protein [Moelleriella libera RCEF 2490]